MAMAMIQATHVLSCCCCCCCTNDGEKGTFPRRGKTNKQESAEFVKLVCVKISLSLSLSLSHDNDGQTNDNMVR